VKRPVEAHVAKTDQLKRMLVAGLMVLTPCSVAYAGDGERALVRRFEPVYPELARKMQVAGTVTLLVSVEADGTVSAVQCEGGHPILARAAAYAVRQWKFAPAPEMSRTVVKIVFQKD
jgi:TonB family protein